MHTNSLHINSLHINKAKLSISLLALVWAIGISMFYKNNLDIHGVLSILNVFVFFVSYINMKQNQHQGLYIQMQIFLYIILHILFNTTNILIIYACFDLSLLTIFIMIYIWGDSNKSHASLKMFIYTFVGSIAFLIAITYMYNTYHTFDIGKISLSLLEQKWIFILLITTVMFKMPSVPLHGWLLKAHVHAPTSCSIILAGIVLKIAGYIMIVVITPLCKDFVNQAYYYIAVLSIVSMIHASFAALRSNDFKVIVAYSSIAHMSFVFISGLYDHKGAILQMISHSFSSCALFAIAGKMHELFETRDITLLKGLRISSKRFFACIFVSIMGMISIPGTANFISEITIICNIRDITIASALACTTLASCAYGSRILYYLSGTNSAIRRDIDIYELCYLLIPITAIIAFGILPISLNK